MDNITCVVTCFVERDGQPKLKRAQVTRACERCRNLRRACSDFRPCQRCVNHGLADQCLGMPGPVQLAWRGPALGGASTNPLVTTGYHGHALHYGPHDAVGRLARLLPVAILDYCTERFFAKLYTTIPILTPEHVTRLKSSAGASEAGLEAHCLLAALCAMVLLQVEEPDSLYRQGLATEKNAAYGERLLEEALSVHRSLGRKSNPSYELCLLTFFLYACHATLLHHSQAFIFLRETTTLWLLLKPSSHGPSVKLLIDRLFWVLLISERSHGVRYRRPVTLQITAETPPLLSPTESDSDSDSDSVLGGFASLAALFVPLDTSFVAALNHEKLAAPPTAASLSYIECCVNTALNPTLRLQDTQKANLRVTQLWLRIILWQIRLRLGHLTEDAAKHSLTFHYPLEVAKDLTLSTRDLALGSIKVHGVGLTEKLFDIASAVVDVLARVPITPSSPHGVGTSPRDDLNYVRRLITQLPGGRDIYDALLDKHIEQAVPGMHLGQVHALPS
ncbi:hypothetical protein SODALDRAFT_343454 [Sodiomyces alkalinus F11]|uniref:Zn(2)-C6 fungal-type domain-containing protein n=1 Tax=Sodiomyces alkalinus (strain CBS 110278 / VKM F-3762 / F11) TaxID=1314773 RepID=A0A3N2Q4A6_SODAK|nr:hypothetical protein SODALDRAFT_343454 [Sodiomyces alkalinus F11]ROT41546.1 hypothetical protein SODALDRAFT_343454 [Sodiomyces alkalinus F11]